VAQRFKTPITIEDATSAASQAVAAKVNGDTQSRVNIDAGGKITWGSGSAAGDTNLYRSAADELTTDDDFVVDGVLTANHIHGNLAGAHYIHVKNTSGSTIAAGTPVYATGSVGASGATEISASDASTASTMPALGITQSSLAINGEGHATVLGVIGSTNTGSYSVNDELYVAPGGGLTNTRPTAATDAVQKIGRVIRSDASTGEILVMGAGRSNDVPNQISVTGTVEGQSGVITSTSSGAPTATISDGAIAVDTTNDKFYFRSGSTWQVVTGGGATNSDTAPSSPSDGDLWFESDTGGFYVYYDSQWIDIGGTSVANVAASSSAPSSPAVGDMWLDTDTLQTFVYYDDGNTQQWVEIGVTGTVNAIEDADGNTKIQVEESANENKIRFDTDGTERMIIDDSGNVGIGTTSPAGTLDVNGKIHLAGGTDRYIEHRSGNNDILYSSDTGDFYRQDIANSSHEFFTGNTQRLKIDSSGNVGIGTTTPSYKLDVDGDINATGDVRVDGNPVGMVLVKTQTIGSGVSSVTVTNAFSSTFENYRIIVTPNIASSAVGLGFRFGTTSTGYYGNFTYAFHSASAFTFVPISNSNKLFIGMLDTADAPGGSTSFDVHSPQLATGSDIHGNYYGRGYMGNFGGRVANTTQYTSFKILPDTGTLTGGTIRVYGYNNG
jgi:hypothetical protein